MAMSFEGQAPAELDNASLQILAQTQLHYACYTGDGHMLDTLIGRAMLYNSPDAANACVAALVVEEDALNGWNPSHWAAFYGQLGCLMKLHVRPHQGFDVPSQRSNVSPLHLAAKSGAILCLKWLLQCGASQNRQDFMGETPLHKAAKTGNSDCAAMLVGHGAFLNVKNYRGLTPSDVAEQSNHTALAQYLRRAAEQAEYGSTTSCSSSPFACHSLPISELSGLPSPTDLKPKNVFAEIRNNNIAHPFVLMNGEGIYNSNCAEADCGMDDMEMEENGNNQNHSMGGGTKWTPGLSLQGTPGFKPQGMKRSFDEDEDYKCLTKRRCTVPSSQKDPIERYGDAYNNSVLSSYNAVLAMRVEPMAQPLKIKQELPNQNVSDVPAEPLPHSSMMEHHASVVAQQGYDSTFMSTISSAFH